MDLLDESERAARLLLAKEQVEGIRLLAVPRGAEAVHLHVARRRGRATVRAFFGGRCARLRLGWNFSEGDLVEALTQVYVRAVKRRAIRPGRIVPVVRATERARSERAQSDVLELAVRARRARRAAQFREERARSAPTLVARVIGFLRGR